MRILLIALLSFFVAVPALAAPLSGSWVLSAEGRSAIILTIDGEARTAKARKPSGMIFDDGRTVSGMKPGIDERLLEAVETSGDSITFRKATERDDVRYRVRLIDDNHAELTLSSASGSASAMPLVRATAEAALPSTAWEDRPYFVDSRWPDNAEMEKIFNEDQADRSDPAKIDWAVVNPRDEARRARTRKLLDEGKLRSGQDYYAAAFIFQHGDKAEDFLLAHSLALAATARGFPVASWIGAATLDRYLLKIGQPQIYGTQFFAKKGEKATQGNYDRTLVPDSLRAVLGVPVLTEQEEQRKAWEERMNPKP